MQDGYLDKRVPLPIGDRVYDFAFSMYEMELNYNDRI